MGDIGGTVSDGFAGRGLLISGYLMSWAVDQRLLKEIGKL
jgi:hypothetical protein